MNGLQLSRMFFLEWGLPFLQHSFPEVVDQITAGTFNGGWLHPPKDIIDWVQSRAPYEEWIADSSRTREREYRLYMLRHGHIFHDPLGDFSARQKAFWSYPEDIWLLRVWQETFAIWHYGQYNFLDRVVHRQDPLAIALCLGYFVDAVMRLCLLLTRDYSPYWKWLPFVFRQLPIATELETPFRLLFETSNRKEQSRGVQEICHAVHNRLIEEQLVKKDAPNPTGQPHPLNVAMARGS